MNNNNKMKWTRLKVYLLPTIMYEIDNVTQDYINLINEIKKTNSNDLLEEYHQLRESIAKRIEEIDNFYEDNVNDPRIYYFEKGRIKLKKLLMYEPNAVNNFDSYSHEFRGINFGYNKDLSEKKNSPNVTNSFNRTEKIDTSIITKGNVQSTNKRTELTTSSLNQNKKLSSAHKPQRKVHLDLDQTNSTRKEMKNIFSFNNIAHDDQWKEITFKIKLTEAEYILLMKEKSKNAFK